MSKISDYLQEHLLGTVTSSLDIRRHYTHDASVLESLPAMIVTPRGEEDIRKAVRFAWSIAERGKALPITLRGGGNSAVGSAIGEGIVMLTAKHLDKIVDFDSKKKLVTVEPGVIYDKLEHILQSHDLFLPAYPADQKTATLGGGISTNAAGERSVKYGNTGKYTKRLRLVLCTGEVIETGLLDKKELSQKLGLTTYEGEIYRALDNLLEENYELISSWKSAFRAKFNSAGYNLFDVKTNDGFDLTPLVVGSEGTLGIITEATLQLESYEPIKSAVMLGLENIRELSELLPKILELRPATADMVNKAALDTVTKINPNQLMNAGIDSAIEVYLFISFDDAKESDKQNKIKSLIKIAQKQSLTIKVADTPESQIEVTRIKDSVDTILTHSLGQQKAIPVLEDVCIPTADVAVFLDSAVQVFADCGQTMPAWGNVGAGILHLQPMLEIAQLGDRQKLFKLLTGINELAVSLNGSITAGGGDGKLKATYSKAMYGDELYGLMQKVKSIFDPHGILNPGVKTATTEEIKRQIRSEYNLSPHR